jgi:ATP-binding cassette subfamily B protein
MPEVRPGLPTGKPPRLQPLRALLPYVARYRQAVALALLFLLLAAGATLALPYAVKLLVDGGLAVPVGSDLGERLSAIRGQFLRLFGVAVMLGLATAARFYMVSWIGERVTTDLRQAVYAHVLRQSPQFFETLKTGEVLSRLTTDTTVIQHALGSSVSMGLRNLVLLLGGMIMLVTTTPRLMLTVAGIIVLVVLPAVLIGRRVRKLSRASQDRIADTSGLAAEILNAIPVVQSYTQENAEVARFSEANEQAFITSIRRSGTRSALTAFVIIGVFGSLLYGMYGGVQAVLAGEISAGQLSQTALYVMVVAGSVAVLAEVWGDLIARRGRNREIDGVARRAVAGRGPAAGGGVERACGRTAGGLRRRRLCLSVAPDAAGVAGPRCHHRGRPDRGSRRPLGCRQDNGVPVAAALLRCRRRQHPD